jgi:hypothetical protein
MMRRVSKGNITHQFRGLLEVIEGSAEVAPATLAAPPPPEAKREVSMVETPSPITPCPAASALPSHAQITQLRGHHRQP